MGIGEDIAEVLEELGTSLTIHNIDGSTVTGEFVDFEVYPSHSTLFTRMFVYTGTLKSDTLVAMGDIVEFNGLYFIVANKMASVFENESIEQAMVFYRSNVTGSLKSYDANPQYDANYERNPLWTDIATNVRACQVEKTLVLEPENHEQISSVNDLNDILYVSANYDIKVGDRWEITADRRFQIESISNLELENVFVCKLAKDVRA